MIIQSVVKRTSKTVDNGTMGFHDYETEYEDFNNFINRVTEKANSLLINKEDKIVSISYPNSDIAIIVADVLG